MNNTKRFGVLNFIIFRDGKHNGKPSYAAVCLELDIVEHGDDPTKLARSIEEAVKGHVELVVKRGMDETLLNRPAPEKYWKKLREIVAQYQRFLTEPHPLKESPNSEPLVRDIWNRRAEELVHN